MRFEEALQTRRLEPIDPQTVLDYVKDLKEFLEESNIFERRAFLRSFIESIEVDDSQITLNYTLPLPPDNTRQEAISVLGIVPPSPPTVFPVECDSPWQAERRAISALPDL